MARLRPEKKRQSAEPAERRVLPMELQVGDRLTDETCEWEIIGRPYTTAGGKDARDPVLGRARAGRGETNMTGSGRVLADLEEFVTDHRPHGRLERDTGKSHAERLPAGDDAERCFCIVAGRH